MDGLSSGGLLITPDVCSAWAAGAARWPDLALPLETFARHVAAVSTDVGGELHAEDLFLACACVERVPGAAEAFSHEHGAALRDFVAIAGGDRQAVKDRADALVYALLFGDAGGAPRLARYGGRGPLRAWLRMAALRRSFDERRDATRRRKIDARLLREVTSATGDPELEVVKARYGPVFAQAFKDALRALGPGDRTLLKLHYGEGVTLAALGVIRGWSRATTARRLSEVREGLLAAAVRLLRERLQLTDSQLDSLLGLVRSELAASLAGLLQS